MRRNIVIPDRIYEQVKKVAENKGVSTAAIIVMACSEYLERLNKKE